MAPNYAWSFMAVPDSKLEPIEEILRKSKAPIGPSAQAALDRWRSEPGARWLERDEVDADLSRAFGSAFLRSMSLFHQAVALLGWEESFVESFGLHRVVPPAALFFALGPDRASRLPGELGTGLVRAGDLARVRAEAQEVVASEQAATLERIEKILLNGNNEGAAAARKLLGLVPDVLEIAEARGEGLFFVAFDPLGD